MPWFTKYYDLIGIEFIANEEGQALLPNTHSKYLDWFKDYNHKKLDDFSEYVYTNSTPAIGG